MVAGARVSPRAQGSWRHNGVARATQRTGDKNWDAPLGWPHGAVEFCIWSDSTLTSRDTVLIGDINHTTLVTRPPHRRCPRNSCGLSAWVRWWAFGQGQPGVHRSQLCPAEGPHEGNRGPALRSTCRLLQGSVQEVTRLTAAWPETEVGWTRRGISCAQSWSQRKTDLERVGAAASPRRVRGWAHTGASLPLQPQTLGPRPRPAAGLLERRAGLTGEGGRACRAHTVQVLHPPRLSILPGKRAFPVGELRRPRCQREGVRGAGAPISVHLPASLRHLLPGGPAPCA